MAENNRLEAIRKLIGDGKIEAASEACRQLIDEDDDPEALYLLAVITGERGLYGESLVLFEHALKKLPGRSDVAYNFGIVLQSMGKLDEAIGHWSRAIELNPEHADAFFNLGRAYSEKQMWEKALEACERAATLQPENPAILYNLGNINFRLGRRDHAKSCFGRTVALDPGYVQGWINLGLTELRNGDAGAATRALEKALALDPDNVLAHFNLGQAMLLDGRLKEGFREVEWRRRVQEPPFPTSGQSPWQGEDIAGKKILLYGEQGQGDIIHFLRYAKPVAALGASVRVYCHPGLVGIAERTEAVEKAAGFSDAPPAFDTHAPLMSLPHLLGLEGLDGIPPAPYVAPPEGRPPFPETLAFRVGLVWGGNPEHDDDANRSAKLADFRPLFEVEEAEFFSLQVGEAAREIERGDLSGSLADLGSGFADFTDTAAAIAALDLVISVDTAVPHLAGAMGRPVWLLLPRAPDWRWFLEGADTPWYPSMRLFRQTGEKGWRPVIERIRTELSVLCRDPARASRP